MPKPRIDRATSAHVLRRVGFGAPREAVDAATERGLDATLEELFARRAGHAAPEAVQRDLDAALATQDLVKLQARWMALILDDAAPLVERVTLMWHGHFATSDAKLGRVRLMHRQNQLFREQGLGDFRALLHAVAKDPAMLLWLDGNQNKVGRPNENFAREVMELFALGVNGGYTEGDIKEAARAFSGWSVEGSEYAFHAEEHDRGEKTLFGRGGVFTGEEALERVLAHPACPRWVARRLLTTFCVPDPTAAQCEEWGRVLVEREWRIDATLERLLRSDLFLGPLARRSRIAGPVELVANVALSLRAKVAPIDAMRAAAIMGQVLFMPPSVKGWDGGRTWIHPGTWLARHNHLMELILAGDAFDARRAYGADLDQAHVVERVGATLLPDGLDDTLRAVLEDTAKRAGSPVGAARDATALLLTAPEFHLY
ncbi:MAG: DUF1800 domain-containing protein [Planctomycetota bacterium]